MEVPKGNPLIENVPMGYEDIDIMHRNLQSGNFTGYIKLDGQGVEGYIFMLHGGMIYSLEYINGTYEATLEWRLKNRAKSQQLNVSTYILSPSLVTIMAQLFAYDQINLNKKKLSTNLRDLEQDGQCGIMEVIKQNTTYHILLDEGKSVTDNILANYGSIVCGSNQINNLTEESSRGVKMKFFGQRQGEIDIKKKMVERELSKIKHLIVIIEKGIFISDAIKVDNTVMEEWLAIEEPGKKINDVEVENDKGNLTLCKVQAKRNIGVNKILVPSKIIKKLDTVENATLIVTPKAS